MFRIFRPAAAQSTIAKSGPRPGAASARRKTVDALAPLPLPQVTEGNTQDDWALWEDSVTAFDSQFDALKERMACVDPFEGIQRRKL